MPPSSARVPLITAILLGVASAAAAFCLIGRVELTFDEAYYTLWSRALALGYLDHPPMVAFWIRASTTLFGGSEFGVRALGAPLFALAPALLGFGAARLFGSARAGAYAAMCWLALPLGAGAALVTPDAPLTLFSLVALVGLIEVYLGRASGWAVVGLSLGLALLSKFTALFLVAGVALALVVVPTLRPQARKPWPYLAGLAAAAIFSPFLAWNATHGWMTFAKQFGRVPASGFRPGYLLEFVAAQLGLANPLLVVAAGAGTRSERRRLLIAYVAPALLYFLVHALHDRVQGNWTAPLYPAFAMLMGEAAANGPLWARRTAKAGITLGVVVLAAVYLHVATGWPALGAADPLARIGGWRELTREVDAVAREQDAAFVLARGYAATSLLTYYGDPTLPVAQSEDPQRWIFAPPALNLSTPGLAFGEAGRGYGDELKARFRTVALIGTLSRRQGGAEVGAYELFRVGEAY
jgi:4-amino-4-deoxy-L-arabinose transferase-like glycosyltransferase